MKKLAYSFAAACALAGVAPSAHAATFFEVDVSTAPVAVGTNNFFKLDLASLLSPQTLLLSGAATSSLRLNNAGIVTFEFLGSESGFFDKFATTFASGNISYQETSTGVINNFASPVLIGSVNALPGIGGLKFQFTNNGNSIVTTAGSEGFGIFLPTGTLTGTTFQTNVLYFGYDDENPLGPDDDNHDDFIIRATVSPVPEPVTWAFMIVGFGAVGYSLRRRPQYRLAQAV